MSKQLALSSAFSIFAMACMVLLFTDDQSGSRGGDALMPVQAEIPSLGLPQPDLLP